MSDTGVVHHQPHEHPDAQPADPAHLQGPGPSQRRAAWQIVIIHVESRWQPALLTAWHRCPGYWAAHIRWRQDPDPTKGWGWFKHDPSVIQPLTVEGLESAGLGE
jgi:hypothetical protein